MNTNCSIHDLIVDKAKDRGLLQYLDLLRIISPFFEDKDNLMDSFYMRYDHILADAFTQEFDDSKKNTVESIVKSVINSHLSELDNKSIVDVLMLTIDRVYVNDQSYSNHYKDISSGDTVSYGTYKNGIFESMADNLEVVESNGDETTVLRNGKKETFKTKYLRLTRKQTVKDRFIKKKFTTIKQLDDFLESEGLVELDDRTQVASNIAKFFANKDNPRLNKKLLKGNITDVNRTIATNNGTIGVDELREYIAQDVSSISEITNDDIMSIISSNTPLQIYEKAVERFVDDISNDELAQFSAYKQMQEFSDAINKAIIDLNNLGGFDDPQRFGTPSESEETLSSEKTILSNEELKYWNSKGIENPRILVASERTDPAFWTKEVIDTINGNRDVDSWDLVDPSVYEQLPDDQRAKTTKNGITKYYKITKGLKGKDFAGLYIITKHDGLPILDLLQTKIPKLIHFSISTLGGTQYEPNTMQYNTFLDKIADYIKQGLDPESVTIRIDPIVPGVTKEEDIENVVKRASELGIKRIRFSVMDGYACTVKAMKQYTDYDFSQHYDINADKVSFHAKKSTIDSICDFMLTLKDKYGIELGTCAEPLVRKGINREGCLSVSAVNKMLGTSIEDKGNENNQYRPDCTCFGGKVDALAYSNQCVTSCGYCYAAHSGNGRGVTSLYYNKDGSLKNNKFTMSRRNAPLGEDISSKGSSFAKKLTNPGNDLTVEYKGKTFRNSEHAYQTWKSGEFDEVAYNNGNNGEFKPQGSKQANKATNFQTMIEILTSKFKQHPELIKGINDRGGINYLQKSTHSVNDQFWGSNGQNKFIEALIEAYKNNLLNDPNLPNKTESYNVVVDNGFTANKEAHTAAFHKKYPNGIIAYRIYDNGAYNTKAAVDKGHIGNPFSENERGEDTVRKFYEWLITGNNFNEPKATDEYRNAIIDRILKTPENSPVLYYTELNRPSHATIIGYLVNNKHLLPNKNTSKRKSTFDVKTAKFYSGGAVGADTEWVIQAKQNGMDANNIKEYRPEDYDALDDDTKKLIEGWYVEARNFLGKPVLSPDSIGGKLTRRDMMQAERGKAVFAIVEGITHPGEDEEYKGVMYKNNTNHDNVKGGTANAVARAIITGKPVYVFDQSDKTWKIYNEFTGRFENTSEPSLVQESTVIGTENLDESGVNAITSILKHSIDGTNQPSTQGNSDVKENYTKVITNYDNVEIQSTDKAAAEALSANVTEFTVDGALADKIAEFVDTQKLLRVFTNNMVYTANITNVTINDNGSVTVRVSEIYNSQYNQDLIRIYNEIDNRVSEVNIPMADSSNKRKIKFRIGSDIYESRVKYLSKRLNGGIKKLRQNLLNAKKIGWKSPISSVFQYTTPQELKELLKNSLSKDLMSEEELKKTEDVYRNYNLFDNEEELKEYVKEISKNKQEANKLILDNYEEFFEDALKDFASFYGLTIDEKEVTEGKKDDVDEKGNVKDKEYDHKAHWQIEIKHMLDTASAELKEFLATIPKRQSDGKPIFNDIGEVTYLNIEEVFDTLQKALKDCFTWSEMERAIEFLSKSNVDYKYILEKLNSSIKKKEKDKNGNTIVKEEYPFMHLKNEMYTLFSVEEIKYSTYYIQKYAEDEEEQIHSSDANISNNFPDILVKKNFLGDEKNLTSAVSTSIKKNMIDKVQLFGNESLTALEGYNFKKKALSFSNKFRIFSRDNESNTIVQFEKQDVKDYNKFIRELTNGVYKPLVKDIYEALNSIGYQISYDDVLANVSATKEDKLPLIDICEALNSLMFRASKHNSFLDWFNHFRNNEEKDFDALLNTIITKCPISTNIKRSSTIYVNDNMYPKCKNISFFGETQKYLKTNNKEERDKWINENFRNINWFYEANGNIDQLKELFNKVRDSISNGNGQYAIPHNSDDAIIIDEICGFFSNIEDYANSENMKKENYFKIERGINNLSLEAKAALLEKLNNDNLSKGIESYSELQLVVPHWKNKIIEKLMDGDVVYRNSFDRERVLSFNKKDYGDWTTTDLSILAIEKYFSNRSNKYTSEYLVPNYSDAGVCEFIRLPKSGDIDECIESLYQSFIQETQRIKLMNERSEWRNAVYTAYNLFLDNKDKKSVKISNPIVKACYDDFLEHYQKTGKIKNYYHNKYFSFPIQNLEDVEEISFDNDGKISSKKKKSGTGKKYQFFSFIKMPKSDVDVKDFESFIKKQIFDAIAKDAGKYVANLKKANYRLSRFARKQDESAYLWTTSKEPENKYSVKYKGLDGNEYITPDERLFLFAADNMCANLALTELLVVDMAQYKDAVDFQKRFKQVYAGTKRFNTEWNAIGNKYARENGLMFEITDKKFDRSFNIVNVLAKARIPNNQKAYITKKLGDEYKDVNGTDGQSFRTLNSFRALLSMSNEWDENIHGVLFDKLKRHQHLTNKELDIFMNPQKPFTFTTRIVNSKTSSNASNAENMKIGYQIKNSEFLLMYLYSQIDTTRNSESAVMYALNKFMVDNEIDVVHYNSAIKVGGQAAYNTNEFEEYKIPVLRGNEHTIEEYSNAIGVYLDNGGDWDNLKLEENGIKKDDAKGVYEFILKYERDRVIKDTIDKLYNYTQIEPNTTKYNEETTDAEEENRIYLDKVEHTMLTANREILKVVSNKAYGLISNEHEHYIDRKQKLGTQLIRLLTADNNGEFDINGKKMNGREIFQLVSDILYHKANIHWESVERLFSDDKKILNKIKQAMLSDSKYSEATFNTATSMDENGKLDMLGDNAIRDQVTSILNSFIREEMNNVKLDGGTCTQVTAVFTDDLQVVYDTDSDSKPYIKYWEAIAPLPFKNIFSRYMDKNGMLDINAFMNDEELTDITKEKMLKCIGCRIPTESKHSIQHIKIVNFSSPQNGSVVFLPYEITKTSGADFDIDHLYMWRYSFNWEEKTYKKTVKVKDKKTGEIKEVEREQSYKIPVYADYNDTDIDNMDEKQLNNYLIDVFWSVLSSSNSFVQELTPNGYDQTKKAAYIGTIINNEDIVEELCSRFNLNKKGLYDKLQTSSLDELQDYLSVTENRIGLFNQLKFFKQNAQGKGELGIMAVNNVFLSLLQHLNINAKGAPIINKYSNGSFNNMFKSGNNIYTGKLTSDTIMEYLAAAPDSAKDPVLMYLGINNHTQNAIIAAALLGYDIQDIANLFNNKYVTEFLNTYFEEDESVYPSKLLRALNESFRDQMIEDGKLELSKDNKEAKQQRDSFLYSGSNISFIRNTKTKVLDITETKSTAITTNDLLSDYDEHNYNEKEKILYTFYKLFCIGSELNDLSSIIRQDSTSGTIGTTLEDAISKMDKFTVVSERLEDPTKGWLYGTISGKLLNGNKYIELNNPDDNPLGFVGTHFYYEIVRAIDLYKGRMPQVSRTYSAARFVLNDLMRNKYSDTDTLKRLTTGYVKYMMYKTSFFGASNGLSISDKVNSVIKTTWDSIGAIKQLYPELSNNTLLKELRLNDKGMIVLPDAGKIKDTDKKELTNAWEDLLNSRYKAVRSLGYNLIRYGFYRNGLLFAPDGFGHLCPDIRTLIPEYKDMMKRLNDNDITLVNEFVSKFIRNNAEFLQKKMDKIYSAKGRYFYKTGSKVINQTTGKEEDEGIEITPIKPFESTNDFEIYDDDVFVLPFETTMEDINKKLDNSNGISGVNTQQSLIDKYGNDNLNNNNSCGMPF